MDLQTIPEKNTQHPHFAKSLVKFVVNLIVKSREPVFIASNLRIENLQLKYSQAYD